MSASAPREAGAGDLRDIGEYQDDRDRDDRSDDAEDGVAAGGEAEVGAARQEVAALRDVFVAIQEALMAALARLADLEAQLATGDNAGGGAPPGVTLEREGFASRTMAPPRPSRAVAAWKLPGWLPAMSAAPVSGAGGGPADGVVTGETLRARREALGISQAAVAHAAHCSRGLVAEVERGKRRSAQTLAHLAAVLDRLEQQARRN